MLAETGADHVPEPHVQFLITKPLQSRERLLEQFSDVRRREVRRSIPEWSLIAPIPFRPFGRMVENKIHPVLKTQMINTSGHFFLSKVKVGDKVRFTMRGVAPDPRDKADAALTYRNITSITMIKTTPTKLTAVNSTRMFL